LAEWCGFDSGTPNVSKHVKIRFSDEPDGRWDHTRRFQKFGRPDLSVRGASGECFRSQAIGLDQISLQSIDKWVRMVNK
jgi:hypothetical protein